MNTARNMIVIWSKFVRASAIDLRRFTRATSVSIVGDTAANRRIKALESLVAVADDMVEQAALEPSVEKNRYPGITKNHVSALRSLVIDAQRMAEGTNHERWSYYARDGWAGDRLRELLDLLGAPLTDEVPA